MPALSKIISLSTIFLVAIAIGVSDAIKFKRTIGGVPVGRHEFKYVARINVTTKSGKNRLCTGAIIDEEFVLTSGDCVSGMRSAQILAGVSSLDQTDGIRISSSEWIIAPDYKRRFRQFQAQGGNIAILILSTKFNFTKDADKVAKIPLPTRAVDKSQSCVVPGWGGTSMFQDSRDLRKASVTLKANEDCLFPGASNLCGDDPNSDLCLGDFGAPLVCNEIAVGIAIGGCCFAGGEMDFINTFYYHDWIVDKMNSLKFYF